MPLLSDIIDVKNGRLITRDADELKEGERVKITSGELKGKKGIFTGTHHGHMAIVKIDGKPLSVELSYVSRDSKDDEEFVQVTGGDWKGKTGVVKKWVPGLHYQTVYAGGESRQIGLEWLKRTEKDSKDDEDFFTEDPLTAKGQEILTAMKKQYGEEKGEEVFYASRNKGTISGVDVKDIFIKGA